jgi:WD40 repeat protein
VTGGWDASIFLWDIEEGKVIDRFKNHNMGQEMAHKACGGAILDMDYSPNKSVGFEGG